MKGTWCCDRAHEWTRRTTLALTVAAMWLLGAQAFGQETNAPIAGEQSANVIEEVLVTAQKREESLQDTPIAMTAFSSRDLERQHVNGVMDLFNKIPSVNLAPFVGTRMAPNLFIRGMGNLNAQSTKDMATGIYIDSVPVGRSVGLATDLADLERVEVLRGPQGTLWGRNTTAGAINFITKKPDESLSFGAQVTAGSWDLRSARVRVNVPFTDRFFVRAAYMRTENDGWVENLNKVLPNQINFNEDRKKEAIRGAVRFELTERAIVDYAFDSSKMIFGNQFYQIIGGSAAVPGRQEKADRVMGLYPSDAEISGHNLAVSWELDGVTVRSISAYRDLDAQSKMNFADLYRQEWLQVQHQLSEELQILGNALNDRLKYTMGLFYFEESAYESVVSPFAGGAVVDSWLVASQGRSKAIYGQLTWTPPLLDERLALTLGLRYTEDAREATKTYLRTDLSPAIPPGTTIQGDRKFDSLNPMVTVGYSVTPSINAYIKYSTGYRSGGFNTQSTPANFAAGFEAEDVKAWEMGLKSEFLGHRVRVNLAAFRNEYTDLQVDQARTPPVFTDTLNAGSATVKGVELETVAVLGGGFSSNIFYSWLDADYQSYIDGGVELAAIRHMQNAPKSQVGVGLQYMARRLPIGNVVLNLDYYKREHIYAGPKSDTLTPGYDIWDARVQVADIPAPRGSFRIAAWVKNLTNEVYRTSTTNLGVLVGQFGPPRSIGVDMMYEF